MSEEMFKSVLEAGQTAIKSSLLINGGAATALLAVLAEALKAPSSDLRPLVPALAWSWLAFVLALGAAGSSSGARYVSQHFFAQAEFGPRLHAHRRLFFAELWRHIAVTLAFTSFVLFFVGAFAVFRTLHP
jgi:hypothetical protein